MKQIIYGKLRVQLLSENIVRIEVARKGKFCDENTFFIPDRDQYKGTQVEYSAEESVICFGEYELYLPERGNALAGVRLERDGKRIYTYRKKANNGELPPVWNTPEVFPVFDCPRILLPEGGYSVNRKGEYTMEEKAQDIYLILCQGDFKKLRRLYVELTGRCEFVRLSTLGGWESKYYPYSEEEAKGLILDYEKHDIPLDNMVIDTDWRDCADGWGYDINTKLFPDMKRFLDFAHEHGVEVMFNDHPEPVAGTKSVFDAAEIAYREEKLQGLLALGLDIWWYDRNWSTRLKSPSDAVHSETLGMYLFTDITKHFFQRQAKDQNTYRRPVIMANVDNIANGNYLGIASSASHRYSIQWTGDIFSDANSLAQEVDSLVRASANCIPYINADCGGHLDDINEEQFVRWMQFGTLSPVFRPHCTNMVKRTRDPWAHGERALAIVREYNNLRYRLLPVLYRAAHESYAAGAPICRPLAWNYPDDRRARVQNSYMLGENILVRPIAGICPADIPAKNYVAPVKATYFDGRKWEGAPLAQTEYPALKMELEHRPPEDGVPEYDFSARFETMVQFDRDTQLFLCVDDGATVWIDGEKVLEDDTVHSAMFFALKKVTGGAPHTVRVDYFQAGGEACCKLQCGELLEGDYTAVYLPAGKWLDAFSGRIYIGGRTLRKVCGLREMPLFIRLGALVPLAYEARNTKEQKWNRLVFDFYPDRESSDSGYLYEDDGETTAYKSGQYRMSRYDAHYCRDCNAYVIKLYAAEGAFAGDRCFKNREITIKCHLFNGAESVKKVTVNGEEGDFTVTAKVVSAFPLNTSAAAPDGETVGVTLHTHTAEEYIVKLYL